MRTIGRVSFFDMHVVVTFIFDNPNGDEVFELRNNLATKKCIWFKYDLITKTNNFLE